jgi:hypothetical protein
MGFGDWCVTGGGGELTVFSLILFSNLFEPSRIEIALQADFSKGRNSDNLSS